MRFITLAARLVPLAAVVAVCACDDPAPTGAAPVVVDNVAPRRIAAATPPPPSAPTQTAPPAATKTAVPAAPKTATTAAPATHERPLHASVARRARGGADVGGLAGIALGDSVVGSLGQGKAEGRGAAGYGAAGYGAGGGGAGAYGSGALRWSGKGGGGIAVSIGSGAARLSGGTRALAPEPPPQAGGTFVHAGTNPIVDVREDPLSTFSIDVDSGSWMYTRRFLRMGRAPVPAAVRVEELVNALHYDYAGPRDGSAFAVHVDAAPSPFTRDRDVVRVAIQGKRLTAAQRKPAHVTFLVDVSGSMQQPDKLPWAKDGIDMAVDALRDDDTVAIVTYAGATRLVLPATPASKRAEIHQAVAGLISGGGTDMGSGMELAYREAGKELGSDRSARVVVLSDGDANIGRTSYADILKSVRGYVSEGVTMSTMGFGGGNYNDNLMEQLADAGNGNYTYIDSRQTLRRYFVDELTSTLEVIAQDAKIQVEWNPEVVRSYRLLGYENRDIADKDFRNDKKDAGEIGAGHAVTALYEIERVDPGHAPAGKLATVRVRHKVPRHEHATELAVDVGPSAWAARVADLDDDAKAALGMALGAEILRGSKYAEGLTLADAARLLRRSAHGPHADERTQAADLFDKAPVRTVAAR